MKSTRFSTKMIRALSATTMVGALFAAGAAQADGAENSKQIAIYTVDNTGKGIVTVKQPSTSQSCFFYELSIPAGSPAAWTAILLQQYASGGTVSITFTSSGNSCTVTNVGLP